MIINELQYFSEVIRSYSYSRGKTTVTVTYDIEIRGCGSAIDGRFRGVNSWERSTSANGNNILVGDPIVISGPTVSSNPALHNIVKAETLARM